MANVPIPAGPPTGFLDNGSTGAIFHERAAAAGVNRWVHPAHQLDADAFAILHDWCGIETIGELEASDANRIAQQLPESCDRKRMLGLIAALKAHLTRPASSRIELTPGPAELVDRRLGSSLDSQHVDPTRWYVRASQPLSFYEQLGISSDALRIMARAVTHRLGEGDHFESVDLAALEEELSEEDQPALREVWSWLTIGELGQLATDTPAGPSVDYDRRVAGDNLGSAANALVHDARKAALRTELERGLLEELPPRIPGTISVHDVSLALLRSDETEPEQHTGYLCALLPALVGWVTDAGPPSAGSAAAFARRVAQAQDYCLETAGAPSETPVLPPEAADDWLRAIDGPSPQGAITDQVVGRDFTIPDPHADGSSFHRTVKGRRDFLKVQQRLAERVDSLRDGDGRLKGGIACFLSSVRPPLSGSCLRVDLSGNNDDPGHPEREAPDWIKDAEIRLVPGALSATAQWRQAGGELVVSTGDDRLQIELGPRPGEVLRPGLYRGAKWMPFRKLEPGFALRAGLGSINPQSEFLILKLEEDDDGTVTAFTAMFRLSRYEVHGWVAYEKPSEEPAPTEGAS